MTNMTGQQQSDESNRQFIVKSRIENGPPKSSWKPHTVAELLVVSSPGVRPACRPVDVRRVFSALACSNDLYCDKYDALQMWVNFDSRNQEH